MELLDPTHIEQFHTVIPLEKQRDNDDLLDEEYIEQRSTEKDLEEEVEDFLQSKHQNFSKYSTSFIYSKICHPRYR